MLVWVNIFALILFIAVLVWMKRKNKSFSTRVFTALGLGIALGLILNLAYGSDSEILADTSAWYNVIGVGYVRLLQMIVMPLVFISIIGAFAKLKLGNQLGKIAGIILAILIGTTAVAAVVGISSAALFDLNAEQIFSGEAEQSRGLAIEESSAEVADQTLPEQLLSLLPANPFLDLTGARPTSTIAVVIFAAFIGFAYLSVVRRSPETAATLKKGIDALYELVMGIVRIVLRLTPYGILAIMARTVATSNFEAIYTLGKFVVASYVALGVMFLLHLVILLISGVNPITYVKKLLKLYYLRSPHVLVQVLYH